MTPEGIRQLLGGYASGTLSEAEKKLLFEAALEDQILFDAMADEQALKDLLDDPESRGYLQAVLDEAGPLDELRRPGAAQEVQSAGASLRPAAAPAPRAAPVPVAPVLPPSRRRPQMWWGLLAAAALAVVSVVGILRLNQKDEGKTEVALNKPAPVSTPATPTAAGPQESKSKEPPSVASKKAEPKAAGPTRPANAAPLRLDQPGDKVAGAAQPASAGGVKEADRDKQSPATKDKKEEHAAAEPVRAAPAPPVQVAQQQNAVNPVPAAAPPPPPPSAPAQDQIQSASQVQVQSELARQQALPAAQSPQQRPAADANTAKSVQTEVAPMLKPKSAGGTAVGSSASAGRNATARGRISSLGKTAEVRATTTAVFSMRVRILRKNAAGEFVPVPTDTKFRAGEEVVVMIEKSAGGFAFIERSGTGAVPMAIETQTLARSVPLTVTAAIELDVTLSRSATVRRPAGEQTTEFVDGAVRVAEPAGVTGETLVVRIPIRLE